MKMAGSITENKSIKFDIEKIKRFTQTELAKLVASPTELPLCYQIGTDILVGTSKITKINDDCWRVFEDGQQHWDFFNRKDAIFYCVAVHKKQLQLAKTIKDNDSLLNKLEFDAILFRHRYKQAQNKNDLWGEEYFSTRYQETMDRIAQTKKELTKSLNLAKFLKIERC